MTWQDFGYPWGVRSAPWFVALFFVFSAALSRGQDHDAAPADTGVRRFELGNQVADIRTECIGRSYCHIPSFGLGVGATLNLNAHFALDTTVDVSPTSGESTNVSGGRIVELLSGGRAEVRAKNYGFFLKAQAGDLIWTQVVTNFVYIPPTTFVFTYGNRNLFASSVGAGFEYSPASRIHIRAEVADLILRYGPSAWTNNLQPTLGVYTSVGRPIDWAPPVYDAKTVHPFFDRYNSLLIAGSLLGMTADAITTQRFISHGQQEGDPFARPLVKYGWSGQISLTALEAGAEILGMYGLHRIHQHLIERMIPVSLATTHGIFAYNNTR